MYVFIFFISLFFWWGDWLEVLGFLDILEVLDFLDILEVLGFPRFS